MNTIHDDSDRDQLPAGMLFDVGQPQPVVAAAVTVGVPRLRRPERGQGEMRVASLDQLLPGDHLVRVVWDYVSGVDIAPTLLGFAGIRPPPGAMHGVNIFATDAPRRDCIFAARDRMGISIDRMPAPLVIFPLEVT